MEWRILIPNIIARSSLQQHKTNSRTTQNWAKRNLYITVIVSIRVISNHLLHSKNSITCYFVNPITFFIKITYLFLKPILKLFLTFTSPYRVSSKEHQRHLFKRGALIKSLCFPVEQFHQPCSFVLTYFTYYTFQRCRVVILMF